MNIKALIICLTLIFAFTVCNLKGDSATNKLDIVRRVYEYQKYTWDFKFQFDNISNNPKISDLVKRLIYKNQSFDEYMLNTENGYIEPVDDSELDNMRSFYLAESYSITYADDKYIVISFNHEEYYGAHPNYWQDCFIVDIAEERLLTIADILKPIPENILFGFIKKHYGEDVDIDIHDFLRDTIWPPDLIYLDGANTSLIWNTYTLLPHAYGPVTVKDYKTITNYLTAKGKEIIKLNTSTELQTETIIATVAPVTTETFGTSGLVYEQIDNNTANRVVSYNGSDADVIIPETYNSLPVTEIDIWAFRGSIGLKSVFIPKSIMSIGVTAFNENKDLASITVDPNNPVYRSEGNCIIQKYDNDDVLFIGFTNSVIPSSVKSIGDWAFSDCADLKSISIPNSVLSLGMCAFSGCPKLVIIVLPNNLLSIGANAFQNCTSLTSIDLPNSVQNIGEHAFLQCTGLTSIVIPKNVMNIGRGIFYLCAGLKSITVDAHNPAYKSEGNCLVSRANNAVIQGLQNSTIPSDVTSIASQAFQGIKGLTSVSLPNGVVSIGESAFADCSDLTNINIPVNVRSIGDRAFEGANLTKIFIPKSVVSIGYNAFEGCENLALHTELSSQPNEWSPDWNVKHEAAMTGDHVYHRVVWGSKGE